MQFATFPETVVPYYPYFSFVQPAHQIIAGREHLRLLASPQWRSDDTTFTRTAKALDNPDHVGIVIHN